MFMNLVKGHFRNKCKGYKMQDEKKGREIDEEIYVDVNYVMLETFWRVLLQVWSDILLLFLGGQAHYKLHGSTT